MKKSMIICLFALFLTGAFAQTPLPTPTNVTATSTSSSVTVNWAPVANATGYVVNLCSSGSNTPAIRQQWDFTGSWTINASSADANLVLDADPLRFNYIPATTNAALTFASGTPIPDVAGLLFTQGGATKIRLGFGKGVLYLNGANLAVEIPCQMGDKVIVTGPAGNATAINRGYSVTGGTLSTSESVNVDASGIMNVAGAVGTWVYTATSTSVKITSVIGGMNIQTIKVINPGSASCTEHVAAGASTATYTVTGLSASTTFSYQVKATNAVPAEASAYSSASVIATTTVTGIASNTNDLSLNVYPNPAVNSFSIGGLTETAKVSVSDLAGKLLLVKDVQVNNSIDLNGLSQGLYMVRISTSKGTLDKKLMVK